MLFPSTTIGAHAVRLLLIRPQHAPGRPIEVTHRFDTIIGEGRTTIEERRAGRASLLLSQRCTLTLTGTAADDWRKGLAALGTDLVGIPLWVDALPALRWKNERIYETNKLVVFHPVTGAFSLEDGPTTAALSDAAIQALAPAPQLIAPLLIGRWSGGKRPAARALSTAVAEVEVTLTEASPFGWAIGINSYGASWPSNPDWSQPITDENEYGLELLEIASAVREPALDRTNSAARWRQEALFSFHSRLAIRQALSWFVAKKGARDAWAPVPAWFQPGADTAQTPDNYTARFASDTLALSYLSGRSARATIGFVQEIDTTPRVQALASEAYLYTLTYQHDTGNPERYTAWDNALVGAEGTFYPGQCAHKELVLSLRPQDARAELEIAYAEGSLLADWIVGRLFGRLALKIEQCDPANVAATRTTLFSGVVRTVLPAGNRLQVTATLFGRTLDKRVPSDVFSPRCNAFVFDARCALAEGDYDAGGTIAPADVSADGFTITVHTPAGWGDGGTGTFAANWFGPNGIFRTGAGRNKQVATIVSSAMAGADLAVKLNRPIFADLVAGGGQAVVLVPGCGGQYDLDCGTKYDNQANFRGVPFMPDYLEQSAPNATPKAKK